MMMGIGSHSQCEGRLVLCEGGGTMGSGSGDASRGKGEMMGGLLIGQMQALLDTSYEGGYVTNDS